MSIADILIVEESIKDIQCKMKVLVREGTSKNNNREKYQKLKVRLKRLNRWIDEIKAKAS